ncbi:response regulator [Methylobacterium phyllosphaerae]
MTSKLDIRPVAVLVVEDDVLVRMIAADILSDAGFRTLEARDAREAMTLLEARGDVRVLFTDWNMPGDIDGLGLARLVRHRWPTVGIILTSGKMRPAPGDLPAGARFLSKPYRPSALIEEVENLLHEHGDGAHSGAPVVPTGAVMQTPVGGALGGDIAAAPSEADKS